MEYLKVNQKYDTLLGHQDILFLLVDVDQGVALKMEIKAMPTFLMMKGGDSTDKLVGANPDAIKKLLK
ncbi:C-terminal cysteine residue is changed to a serine 1 [Prunus dulcis]|uniref:C-terminal cysteine residue is changed to a serine 1 n=1 Tax=Prunus dulcis TaxID=3755 RepID=A0A4Y1RCF2_PRUDU|nr:C-terminal cysteine residue is changed to a serine 1 [Prunus dulcis]